MLTITDGRSYFLEHLLRKDYFIADIDNNIEKISEYILYKIDISLNLKGFSFCCIIRIDCSLKIFVLGCTEKNCFEINIFLLIT